MYVLDMTIEVLDNYCTDWPSIENFELAFANTHCRWECHHRLGQIFSRENLVATGLYLDRPADEFILLTIDDHRNVHRGKHLNYLPKHILFRHLVWENGKW